VTVGAASLHDKVVRVSGDHGFLAFLVAGLVAAFTALSYAVLAGAYRALQVRAIYVKMGLEMAGHRASASLPLPSPQALSSVSFAGYLGR
jgi:amino acid transporter